MGGPQALADVEPFLINLFSDREIIRLGPKFLQGFLARRIAGKRAAKSAEAYRIIGGGSPLTRVTLSQAEALSRRLAVHGDFRVTCAMRYWHPLAEEAMRSLLQDKPDRLLLLPLYPHYSRATSGSSIKDMLDVAQRLAPEIPVAIISSWPDQKSYISSLSSVIQKGMSRFGTSDVELVYSAHSLPVSFIEEGDPYVQEVQKTIDAVEKATAVTGTLCYQSRSGPVKWLTPSTPDIIKTFADRGVKNMLLVPISFVSDHIETLYEIDVQYKQMARSMGIRLERTESLNTAPLFIQCLEELVLSVADETAHADV